jgi:hypothetical protein
MKETFPNDLAFARSSSHTVEYGSSSAKDGLTKREYFAVMVMQGMGDALLSGMDPGIIAKRAVTGANALIEALNKQK